MPRFNLRQLLLAITLAGIGLGMIVFGTGEINHARDFVLLPVLIVGAGCAAVGFGARILFKRTQIGLLVSMAVFFYIMFLYGRM